MKVLINLFLGRLVLIYNKFRTSYHIKENYNFRRFLQSERVLGSGFPSNATLF
jgi:hypothetical protein